MTISVAIAGGGIAGLSLARGLSQYAHLHVTVYEATTQYRDIGGGLAFHGNAIRALGLIDPELQAEFFRRATLMTERDIEMATRVLVGDMETEDGKPVVLAELGKAKGRKAIARSDLLEGFLSLAPVGVVSFGKRLVQIEEASTKGDATEPESIHLTFKDGTTATSDVLIGCDGVHSAVRKHLLGPDHPAAGPKNHDRWTRIHRTMPAEEVNELNNKLLSGVGVYCGHGVYMTGIPTRSGKTFISSIFFHVPKESGLALPGSEELVHEYSIEDFTHWTKNARDIATLTLRDPSTEWPLQDHDPAPFYSRGLVTMVGDAAHATMPFNGQGAAQSVEDAALLTALFAHVTELDHVERAFKIYEESRMSRTQNVAEISRQFGRLYSFEEDAVGEDLNKMRAILGAGGKYTNDFDLQAMNEQAVRKFLQDVQ